MMSASYPISSNTYSILVSVVCTAVFVSLGFLGCADDPASDPSDERETLLQQEHAANSSVGGTLVFSQPMVEKDYQFAWPYGFDNSGDKLSTTVLALGDVQLQSNGTLHITGTPYETIAGDKVGTEWSYSLVPTSIGRTQHTTKIGLPEQATHEPSRAFFNYRQDVEVVYEHRHEGLKLFVHVDQKPDGDGPLRLEFQQTGDSLNFESDGMQMVSYMHGEEVFRWAGLVAFDSTNKPLRVRMNNENGHLVFEVDDTDAVYPITVDPLATSPSWTTSGSSGTRTFGNDIALGDVNGNGHLDALITDPWFSGNEDYQGRALLFLGDGAGFSNTQNHVFAGDTENEQLGFSAVMDADFVGDGCDDVLLSAPGYNGYIGRVVHYQPFDCSLTDPNLAPVLHWTAEGEVPEMFGRHISVGDFNCNGNPDVLVGIPIRSVDDQSGEPGNAVTFAGALEIYFGDPSAADFIESSPGFRYSPAEEDDARFGWRTTSIPELDGRDYNTSHRCDSFAASSRHRDDGRGGLYIFDHSEDGDIELPPLRLDGDTPDEGFATSLEVIPSPNGTEVDGQSLSAIVVGTPAIENDTLPGRVSIVEYSETTDSFEEIWSAEGPHPGSQFGIRMSGGIDFNADSYHDLAIGARHYSTDIDEGGEGGVFVFLGAPSGLSQTAQVTLESDQSGSQFGYYVQGISNYGPDGTDALFVSAPRYDGLVPDGGRVFLYPGQKTCYIDGEFYSAGEDNPNNFCEVCDPDEDAEGWSDKENGLTCDDGDGCTISTCQDGICVDDGEIDCDDGNPCTHNYCDSGECMTETEPQDGAVCDDDGVSCTTHLCDGGACEENISEGCYIDGACYDEGEINPGAECFHCDSTVSQTEWSPRDEGEPCDNGLYCTIDDTCDGAGQCVSGETRQCDPVECFESVTCSNAASSCIASGPETGTSCDIDDGLSCTAGICQEGSCENEIVDNTCLIDGVCYADGEEHPSNPCLVCDSEVNNEAWSTRPDGSTCDDGDACTTGGTCQTGTCVPDDEVNCDHLDDQCNVGVCDSQTGECYAEAVADGTTCDDGDICTESACQSGSCTAISTVDCDDGNPCTIGSCDPVDGCVFDAEAADGMSCADGEDLSCASGICDGGDCNLVVDDGYCAIDEQCFADGAFNPLNDCEYCDSDLDSLGWSAASAGLSCGGYCTDENEFVEFSVCDGEGLCMDNGVFDCGDYLCEDEVGCPETCDDDADCYEDAYCTDDNECSSEARLPVADAGADQFVASGAIVTLDGTGSYDPDGNPLTYMWSQLSGESVALSDPTAAAPTFEAPVAQPGETLELEFELVVSDGELDSVPDQTFVFVDDEDAQMPVAIIEGPDEAACGQTVTLDGSESFDPDGGTIEAYSWQHIAGDPPPHIAAGAADYLIEVTIPEEADEGTVYAMGLLVNNGMANSELTIHEIVAFDCDVFLPGDEYEPGDDVGDDAGIPDTGIPDAGDPDDPAMEGQLEGSGCVCSAAPGSRGDTEGMIFFVLLLGVALWKRRRALG